MKFRNTHFLILIMCLMLVMFYSCSKHKDPFYHHIKSNLLMAVPTFNCIGIYWSNPKGGSEVICHLRYRISGENEWKDALPPWYDDRTMEYRGSIVNLQSGKEYDLQLSLDNTDIVEQIKTRTWTDEPPISKVIYIPEGETYRIREGGSPEGYVLYTCPPDSKTVLNARDQHDECLAIEASYVIVRGLTLKGARINGIDMRYGVHDIIIEENNISNWGRKGENGFGSDKDAGIRYTGQRGERIIIQGNKIHHPRYGANNWKQYNNLGNMQPQGPRAIYWNDTKGNHVIRYNEIYSDNKHCFSDGIGGSENAGRRGFPGSDSDIYGNRVSHAWDDAMEIEGGGRNVRVWGNYLDETFTGIGASTVSEGPLYVFRNVMGCSRMEPNRNARGAFGKLGDYGVWGSGRQYWLHNTVLQQIPSDQEPKKLLNGASCGIDAGGRYGVTDCISYNNIWQVERTTNINNANRYAPYVSVNTGNNHESNLLDYDLFNGAVLTYSGAEKNGIKGLPFYAKGNGPMAKPNGMYQLHKKSPGYDAGRRLPNFNDNFEGMAPDIGAHEVGSKAMVFGLDGYKPNRNPLTVKEVSLSQEVQVEANHCTAVPTFECISLYWNPFDGGSHNTCQVRYRPSDSETWIDALPLWFDTRNYEYRGSIVNLKPGTQYDILLSLESGQADTLLKTRTWSQHFQVAKTIKLTDAQTYSITEGGSKDGYMVYTGDDAHSINIDAKHEFDHCITIEASFVIIRNLNLKGARKDAILIANGVHDVIIEDNDISDWGSQDASGFGRLHDAGIKHSGYRGTRFVIQRNRIHHPRYGSNNWLQPGYDNASPLEDPQGQAWVSIDGTIQSQFVTNKHPDGPQGIVWVNSEGNHVIRYNEIYSDEAHCFDDGMGERSGNADLGGFPGPDTDIYGNVIKNCWDDAMEIEGGGRNVRVWGNLLDMTFIGIATTRCKEGPIYVFRNVMGRSRWDSTYTVRGSFAKVWDHDIKVLGNKAQAGAQYWFHNTVLQPKGEIKGAITGMGALMNEVTTRNNIFHVSGYTPEENEIVKQYGGMHPYYDNTSLQVLDNIGTNSFDYDLYNGEIEDSWPSEQHGIFGIPIYSQQGDPDIIESGNYWLDPSSPGYDAGVRIPNFNDRYNGEAPDIGALEGGMPAMKFGVDAYQKQ